ncbi:phospholipase-like protein [Tanacetum coccineum]
MSKRQRQLHTSTRRSSKRHIQEVVSAADNGEVVKETQLPDSHEDVFQPRASKRMKKETLLSHWPPVIGNYLKEIHLARWEERFQRAKDKNTRPQRSFRLFKSSKEAMSLVSLGEWLERSRAMGLVDVAYLVKACRLGYFLSILLQSSNVEGPGGLDIQGHHVPCGVYIPVNIPGIHWFLAVFKIRKGVFIFYDTLSDKKPWDKDDCPWWIKFWQLMSKQLQKGMSKHGVFKQKNIHPKGYTITFTSPLHVPKQSGVYDDCGV